jgi:hypothetical protein
MDQLGSMDSPAKHAASSTPPATKSALSRCNSQRTSGQSLPHIQAVHVCRHISLEVDQTKHCEPLHCTAASCQSSTCILAAHVLPAFAHWPQSRLHQWCRTKQTHL